MEAKFHPVLVSPLGINVRKGKGRYRDTHIVTFAPRYLLDNRSSHKLAFSQREFARGKVSALLTPHYTPHEPFIYLTLEMPRSYSILAH